MTKFIGVYHPKLDTTTVVAESAFERVHSKKGWVRITAQTPKEKILEAADALGVVRKKGVEPDIDKIVLRINGGTTPATEAEDPSTDEGDQSDGDDSDDGDDGPEDDESDGDDDPEDEVDTRSPAQKAADTRRQKAEAAAQQGDGSDSTNGSTEG